MKIGSLMRGSLRNGSRDKDLNRHGALMRRPLCLALALLMSAGLAACTAAAQRVGMDDGTAGAGANALGSGTAGSGTAGSAGAGSAGGGSAGGGSAGTGTNKSGTNASDSAAAAPAPSPTGKPVITVSFRDDGRGKNNTLWKWLLSGYDSYVRKDSFTLDIAPITASEGDYFAKIALQLASDRPPDIVAEDTFQLATDVEAGYLAALDDYLTGYVDWIDGSYHASLLNGVTGIDGKIYGVPYSTDTRGLWYNRELFVKAGLPEAWSPKNWGDVLAAAHAVHNRVPDVIPFWCNSAVATGEATSMQTYLMLLHGTGETLRDEATGKWIVASQGILDSLSFLETVYRSDLGPPLSKVLNGQAGNLCAREYLPQGKVAIALDGSWIAGNYLTDGASPWPEFKETMGFVPMPTQYGQAPGCVSTAGGWAWSIPARSQSKGISISFIEHMMDPSVYTDAIVSIGGIGARTDVKVDDADMPFNRIASDFLAFASFRPKDSRYPSVSAHIQTMVESVVSGTSPLDAMATYGVDVARTVGEDSVMVGEYVCETANTGRK